MKPDHKDQIIKLRKEGKTYGEIQEILGCSKGTISYHVGAGQKEKTQQRTKKNREMIRKYIQDYKEEIGCIDCGEKYPYFILDLDHLKDKKFNLSRFWNSTNDIEKVKEEMAKCEVVCSNCHRIRTHSRTRLDKELK